MSEIVDMIGNLRDLIEGLMVVLLVPMLLNCFFGYKILKIMITLGGALVGAVVGALLGVLSGEEAMIIVLGVLFMLLFGFLAFKLYKLGIFLHFWFLGTVIFAVVFIMAGNWDLIGVSVIIGLVIGVLAVVLHKGFVIITTSFSGGMTGGVMLGMTMELEIAICIAMGVFLSILGMIVQFAMEKKRKPDAVQGNNAGTIPANVTVHHVYENQPATTGVNVTEPVKTQTTYTELSKTAAEYYCAKGKVLIDSIAISKDDTNKAYVTLEFRNIGDVNLAAVYFTIKGYGVAGEDLGEKEYTLIDLNVAPNTGFCSGRLELFDPMVRKVEVYLTQTVNGNFEVTKLEEEDTKKFPELTPLCDGMDAELMELLGPGFDENYWYQPLEEGLWICTCGHVGYHVCTNCGRDNTQSLKNTDEAVVRRITDNVTRLLAEKDACKNAGMLRGLKSRVERTVQLLEATKVSEESLDRCKAMLEEIETGLTEFGLKAAQTKKKAKKITILALSAVAVIAVAVVAVKIVIGLPPSDKKILAEAEEYMLECIGEEYEIIEFEIEKEKEGSRIQAVVEITSKLENGDETEVTVSLKFLKRSGKYRCVGGNCREYTFIPKHEITEKDSLPRPDMYLYYEGGSVFVDGDESDSGSLKVEYEIDYSDVRIKKTKATVPVTLRIEYGNGATETVVEVPYTYIRDGQWSVDTYLEVQLSPKETILNRDIITGLLANSSITYMGEKLPGQFLKPESFEPSYSEAYTKATLRCDAAWDNADVRLDGDFEATFEYRGRTWVLSSVTLVNTTKTRYKEVTDTELFTMIKRCILEKCTEKTNVTDVQITGTTVTREGMYVEAVYNSESEYFYLENKIRAYFDETILQGYVFQELTEETTTLTTFKEDKREGLISDFVTVATEYENKKNVDNVAITGVSYTAGGIVLNMTYDCVEGYFVVNRSVELTLLGTASDGTRNYSWLKDTTILATIPEESKAVIPVEYSLSCNNATPVGMPSAGTAELSMTIRTDRTVTINGYVGNLYLQLNGRMEYPENDISINSYQQKVYVAYQFIFNSKADLTFDVTPSLSYKDGKLTGRIYYDCIGIGAGEFTVTFK